MTDQNRPNPGSQAARRARRIGGRPAPVPTPASGPTPIPRPAPEAWTGTTGTDELPPPADRADLTEPERAGPAAGTEVDGGSPPSSVRSLPLAWFPAAVFGVAAVLLLVLLAVFSFRGYWARPDTQGPQPPSTREQEQVLAAAKNCFATLNTYDYRKLDDALAKGLTCTTGKFTTDYQNAFTTQVKQYAPKLKAVQSVQVNKAGIASISPDGKEWEVLIYAQIQTVNVATKSGQPRVAPGGWVLKMDQVDGKWLVGKVDADAGNGLTG